MQALGIPFNLYMVITASLLKMNADSKKQMLTECLAQLDDFASSKDIEKSLTRRFHAVQLATIADSSI